MKAILVALALVAGFIVPAAAQEAGPCIWITPEGSRQDPGTEVVATIFYGFGEGMSGEAGDACNRDVPPPPDEPRQVDLEVTGTNDPDASDTPDSPDLSCELPAVSGSSCSVSYVGNDVGVDVLRAWIDGDRNDATDERDDTEGSFEGQEPGEIAEPDATEVVSVDWRFVECSDGLDNDGDGASDYPQDPNCDGADDDMESEVVCVCFPPACATPAIDNLVIGTEGDDELNGTPRRDCIVGFGGRDIIRGRGGGDLLVGGDGPDVIFGGAGTDKIRGKRGHDSLRGGRGGDRLKGGSGADFVRGNGGFDRGYGGDHKDNCRAERTRSCEVIPG